VTGLLAKKSDGENHRDGAQDFTRIAHHTARNVDCDDRRSLLGRGGQSFLGGPSSARLSPAPKIASTTSSALRARLASKVRPRLSSAPHDVCFALQTFARSE